MPVDSKELGRRLKSAREMSRLTQEQVAAQLGVSRPTITQIELGNRPATSLEIDQLSRIYGRSISHFIADTFDDTDPLVALFRLDSNIADNQTLNQVLRECASLCREVTNLESLLELSDVRVAPALYTLPTPTNKWEAIQQGDRVANLERRRLNLGHAPVWDIPALLEPQGVRWIELEFPEDVSGLFLASEEVGLCILVNKNDHSRRKSFSYAHEYAHLLLDRNRRSNVSRDSNKSDLSEVRANAFAASFLMPAGAVRDFMQSLGKGQDSRSSATAAFADDEDAVVAQHRPMAHSQDIQLYDVVHLARHFAVSFPMAVYRLRNLRLVTESESVELLKKKESANALYSRLRKDSAEETSERQKGFDTDDAFQQYFLSLSLEAFRRELITQRKLEELARRIGMVAADVADMLQKSGILEPTSMGAEDVRIPR